MHDTLPVDLEPTPGASLEGAFGAATLGAAGISLNRTAFTQLNSTLQNLMRGDGTYTLEVRPSPTGSRMVGILDGEETDFRTILSHASEPDGLTDETDRYHLQLLYEAVKQGFNDLDKQLQGKPMTPDQTMLFDAYTTVFTGLHTILTTTAPDGQTRTTLAKEAEILRTHRVKMLGGRGEESTEGGHVARNIREAAQSLREQLAVADQERMTALMKADFFEITQQFGRATDDPSLTPGQQQSLMREAIATMQANIQSIKFIWDTQTQYTKEVNARRNETRVLPLAGWEERETTLPMVFESEGVSYRGGRPNGPDEDGIYTSGEGFHFGEVGGVKNKITPYEERVRNLLPYLSGLNVNGEVLPQLTSSDIVSLHHKIQQLIIEGKLGGIDVVCDGMGGQGSGEIASSIGTFIFVREIAHTVESPEGITEQSVRNCVWKAHLAVKAFNEKYQTNSGATFVAQVTDKTGVTWIPKVGDARAYAMNERLNLIRIGKDDSLVESFVDIGQTSPSQVLEHPQRNLLTRNLGDPHLKNDVNCIQVHQYIMRAGNGVVLCCDGPWEGLDLDDPVIRAWATAIDSSALFNIQQGNPLQPVKNMAFGKLLQLHLTELRANGKQASTYEILAYLTRMRVAYFSQDNISAVVTQRKK